MRLREKAKDCEFGPQTYDRILEQLIQTIKDNDLIKKSIQKRWILDQFLEEASQKEDINQQVNDTKEDYLFIYLFNRFHHGYNAKKG